jgi:hypothetical protein
MCQKISLCLRKSRSYILIPQYPSNSMHACFITNFGQKIRGHRADFTGKGQYNNVEKTCQQKNQENYSPRDGAPHNSLVPGAPLSV